MVAIDLSTLSKRATYQCTYYGNCGYTAWGGWGRWVLLGGIILLFLVFFSGCARVTGMRRRRQGLKPYAGTAWVLPKYEAGPNAQYPPGPPPYNPPTHNNDTPMQPQQSGNYYAPQNNYTQQPSYNEQQHTQYAPPAGAPPQESGFVAGSSNPYYPPPTSPPQSHLKH